MMYVNHNLQYTNA